MKSIGCWSPLPGAQTEFLKRSAFEALFYGGPGGGKTDALIVSAIQHVGCGYGKNYRAVLFRNNYPNLHHTITRRTHDLYPGLGGTYDEARETWRFLGGETVALCALPDNTAASTHSGREYSFIGFDNLSTFTEAHYLWMVARCRGPEGVPLRIRATQNPPHALDPAHEQDWVVERWAPWLDPKFPLAVSPHKALRFKRKDGSSGPLRGIVKADALPSENPHSVRYGADAGDRKAKATPQTPTDEQRLVKRTEAAAETARMAGDHATEVRALELLAQLLGFAKA